MRATFLEQQDKNKAAKDDDDDEAWRKVIFRRIHSLASLAAALTDCDSEARRSINDSNPAAVDARSECSPRRRRDPALGRRTRDRGDIFVYLWCGWRTGRRLCICCRHLLACLLASFIWVEIARWCAGPTTGYSTGVFSLQGSSYVEESFGKFHGGIIIVRRRRRPHSRLFWYLQQHTDDSQQRTGSEHFSE